MCNRATMMVMMMTLMMLMIMGVVVPVALRLRVVQTRAGARLCNSLAHCPSSIRRQQASCVLGRRRFGVKVKRQCRSKLLVVAAQVRGLRNLLCQPWFFWCKQHQTVCTVVAQCKCAIHRQKLSVTVSAFGKNGHPSDALCHL